MKRMLTLLLAALLLCTAALAEDVTLSPELTAQKLAVAALHEKYGLTMTSLGLFAVDVLSEGGAHIVHYRPHSYLPVTRIGEYTVRVKDNQAEAAWTHDDADAAQWQSADMDSPAWGEKHLQAILEAGGTGWLAPYYISDEEPAQPPSLYDRLAFHRHSADAEELPAALGLEKALTRTEALRLADAALTAVYGLTDADVAAMDHDMDAYYLTLTDGRILWDLNIASHSCGFIVLVDAVSGEVFHIDLFTGGNG